MDTEKNRESGLALPGKHPNSLANLVPQKPGEQSINPRGRPKGSRNIRTILDEMLHRYVDVEALKHLKGIDATVELCKQLCDAKNDSRHDEDPKGRARLYDLIVAAQFTRALQEQDLPSFKELVDRYEGAVAQKFEDVTPLKNAEDEEIMKMVEGSDEHDSEA
jgi:flagellar motility protein MotE (MotC chaperone)